MKTKLKKRLAGTLAPPLILLLALLAWPAAGQQLKCVTNDAVVLANTANALASDGVMLDYSQYIGVELSANLAGTNAYTNTVLLNTVLETSITGTNWYTNGYSFNYLITSTNSPPTNFSINVGGVRYIRKKTFTATGTSHVTNLNLCIFPKREGW